jgi:hypothetical protein
MQSDDKIAPKKTYIDVLHANLHSGTSIAKQKMLDTVALCLDQGGTVQWLQSAMMSPQGSDPITTLTAIMIIKR